MKKHLLIAAALVCSALLAGCSSSSYTQRYKPRIGMTMEEVEQSAWGKPMEYYRRKLTTRYGQTECWYYPQVSARSVCFGNTDRVISITE